jgi:hypothetical protein
MNALNDIHPAPLAGVYTENLTTNRAGASLRIRVHENATDTSEPTNRIFNSVFGWERKKINTLSYGRGEEFYEFPGQ